MTHNYWHGCVLLLEDRGEPDLKRTSTAVKQPPSYDGNYTEQLLDPFKQVNILNTPLILGTPGLTKTIVHFLHI